MLFLNTVLPDSREFLLHREYGTGKEFVLSMCPSVWQSLDGVVYPGACIKTQESGNLYPSTWHPHWPIFAVPKMPLSRNYAIFFVG